MYDDTAILASISSLTTSKQDKLTAGDNIHIENNVVSADMYDDTAILASISSLTTSKQDKLTAGDNIHIENNVVSADMYDDSEIRGEISAQNATISEHSTSINANTAAIGDINNTLENKQNKLTAGRNIVINASNSYIYSNTGITRNAISITGAGTTTSAGEFAITSSTADLYQYLMTGNNGDSGGAFGTASDEYIKFQGHATIVCTSSLVSIGKIYLLSKNSRIYNGKTGHACGFAKITYTTSGQSYTSSVLRPVTTYYDFMFWGFVIESSSTISIDKTKSVTIELFLG